MRQSENPWSEVMVVGIKGQDGQYFARAQANAEVEHPDQAVRRGRLAQAQALEHTGRVDAPDAQAHDPIADGLRTRRCLDAKRPSH
jgi:hypothetical protein